MADPEHVLEPEVNEIEEDLTYEELPVEILDREEKMLRWKTVQLIKVLWRNHKIEEAIGRLRAICNKSNLNLFTQVHFNFGDITLYSFGSI